MKTPQQWAEHLPEPIRSQFLENIDKDFRFYELTNNTLNEAIAKGFKWADTKQGHDYWKDIFLFTTDDELTKPQSQPITREIQLLRDVETEVNISGIISNHTYSEIVKLLKEVDGNENNK